MCLQIQSTWSNVRSERWLGRTEFRPKDYMRTFVGDDEFVQPKRNETAPRSECRFTFKNAFDTAEIVRDGRKTGLSEIDPEHPFIT
jgi:hypothetical protein